MFAEQKTTVPDPPAATGGGQPSAQTRISIVSDGIPQGKPHGDTVVPDQEILQYFRLRDRSRGGELQTTTLTQLMDQTYPAQPPVIDGLLHTGTYLFVGAPKVGKSFLMAQLAYHISSDRPIWGHAVHAGTVLYLALEDDHRRLQARLYRMFGPELSDRLHFAVTAKPLEAGLEQQLRSFVRYHPDTRVMIVDTLQKIRPIRGENYSYANDYQVISQLKQLADELHQCLLLVHHTRKQQANDRFDMISGTNGLLGAADGAFLLHKENRTDGTAILELSGRDLQDQRLYLRRDPERLLWQLDREETQLWKPPPEPVLEAVARLVTPEHPQWTGTATQLLAELGLDLKANTLSLRLNVNAGRLLEEYHIQYQCSRSHAGRSIRLQLLVP